MPEQARYLTELVRSAYEVLADMKALPMIRHRVNPNEDDPDLKLIEHFQAHGSTAQEALKLMEKT